MVHIRAYIGLQPMRSVVAQSDVAGVMPEVDDRRWIMAKLQ